MRHAAWPGGSEERGGEDGADKRVRAVSGWARGVGGCLVRAGRGCWAGDAEARGCWAESGGWAERGRGEEGERAAEERACRPKPRKGVERKKFPFSFYK